MASFPNPANAVRENLLDDTSSDQKTRAVAGDHEIQWNGDSERPKLQRYWVRTLALILIPAIVTAWYGVIWVELVLGVYTDDAVRYRNSSGSVIFYSWFIIGVFGLSWAKFGLEGVEVAMLQTPFWRAPNLVAFLMHSNSTWSGLSGWLRAIYHRQFHRLWSLFAILSILPFIAFPLSGLVLELSNGYVATLEHPRVVGRNQTNFNHVYPSGDTVGKKAWVIGATPSVPGFGVVYTPQGTDRSRDPGLNRVPNTLPLINSIPDMFLAPQAEVPVSGKAWGLRVKYDCSNVRSASEFTILNEKSQSTIFSMVNSTVNPSFVLKTPSGWIDVSSTSTTPPNGMNMWAHREIGTKDLPTRMQGEERYDNATRDFEPHDVSKSSVLEIAIWQIHFTGAYDHEYPPGELRFNSTLDPVIEGMRSPYSFSGGNFTVNDDFFKIRGDGNNITSAGETITNLRNVSNADALVNYHYSPRPALDVAAPIGVRCIVSSGLGTAELDGTTSTFSDFKRVDPGPSESEAVGDGHLRFGNEAYQALNLDFFELYGASHLPPKEAYNSMYRYRGYVHSQALKEAVLLGYGLDALQLMYELYPGEQSAWMSESLTSSEEGRIMTIASLIPGTAVGYLVLVLFSIWAALSAALGIIYGFRKRPSDILSGYEAFGHGVELAGDVKHNEEFKSRRSFYNSKTFRDLPGSQLYRRRT